MSRSWIESSQFHVHWDHHPSPKDTPRYGAGTNADEIRQYIRAVRPDMMQYHALGCHGYASFPSKIAPPVPGLAGDPLRVWRDVCRQEGVRLGIYVATEATDDWRYYHTMAGEVHCGTAVRRQIFSDKWWTELP